MLKDQQDDNINATRTTNINRKPSWPDVRYEFIKKCRLQFYVHFNFSLSFLHIIGATMHLQGLTSLQVYDSTLEAFTQAALILILGVAIVASNVLIIATIVNFRGNFWHIFDIDIDRHIIWFFLLHSWTVGGNQPLFVIVSRCRSSVWPINCSFVSLSSTDRTMAVWRSGMSFCWLPRGDTVVSIGVYIYVDICR